MTDLRDQLDEIRDRGFSVLNDLYNSSERAELISLFDADWRVGGWRYTAKGREQSVDVDVLVRRPEVALFLRPDVVVGLLERFFVAPVAKEVSFRLVHPHLDEEVRDGHRDKPPGVRYLQLLVYLSDVGPDDHCFAVSPEKVGGTMLTGEDNVLSVNDQLARSPWVDILGPAGTAVLFDVSTVHTRVLRKTERSRKTLQVYYGERGSPPLSDYSHVPASLRVDPFFGDLLPG